MAAPTLRGTDSAVNNGGSPNTITLETPASTQAGDAVIVAHALNFLQSSGDSLATMPEPGGDIDDWELIEQGANDGAYLKVWIGHATQNGVNEVTLSTPPSNPSSNYGLLRVYAGDVVVEDTAVADGVGDTSLTVGPVTPTSSSSELCGIWTLIGFAANPYSITVPVSMSGTQVSVTDVSGFQPLVMGHELLADDDPVSRTATASAAAERGWVGALLVVAAAIPPQVITDPNLVPAPGAPYQPTVEPVWRIYPEAVPAPPDPFAVTVIPGPVFIVDPTPIPAPPAPFEPKVVQVVTALTVPDGSQVFPPTIERGIRPPLRVDFWAVDDDGSILCPLPTPVSWQLSMEPGEPGAITLEYPVDGINFDVLDERVTATRDLEIRIRVDGKHSTSLGGLLQSRDGDEVAEQGTVTFYGKFLTHYLSEAVVAYNTGDERGETVFPNSTAGHIMHELLTAAQDRGTLTHLHWRFNATVDSRGTPWSMQTSAVFSPGRTYLEVLQQLREWGMVEFEVTTDHEVVLLEPSTVGTDHTQSDPPVILRAGRDLLEATRRMDVTDAATDLLVAGKDGVYVSVSDPTARAQRGRQIERYVSEGNLTSEAAALAYGTVELQRTNHGADEVTHALTMDPDQPGPMRELLPLDWVYSDRGRGLEKLRVMQVTISQSSGQDHIEGSVVVGDLIDDADTRLARRLEGFAGGQIIAGTSTPAPDYDDGLAPATPQGLNLVSIAYPVQDGHRAVVTASWLPVTTNEDNSPIRDLDHYEVEWRYAHPGLPTDWVAAGNPGANQTALSWSTAPGVGIQARVRAWDRWGHASEWSSLATHTTEDDTTPPPVPSRPIVSNYIGVLRIEWDGLGSSGEDGRPPDFDRVEIHASEESDFDPVPESFAEGGTLIGTFRAPGVYAWSPPGSSGNVDYGVEWFVKLVSVDKDGNRSDPSEQDSAIPGRVEDGDIAELNVGKLTSGILTAIVANAGRIWGGVENGERYELDNSGIRFYNSSNELTFDGGGADGDVWMRGEMEARRGTARIVVTPGSPSDGLQTPGVFFLASGSNASSLIYSVPEGSGPAPSDVSIRSSVDPSTSHSGFVTVQDNLIRIYYSRLDPPTPQFPNGVHAPIGGNVYLDQNEATLDVHAANGSGFVDGGIFHATRTHCTAGHLSGSTYNAFIQFANDRRIYMRGRINAFQADAGQSAIYIGFDYVNPSFSGLIFSYGTTMADQRVILHSWQGTPAYTYMSQVSATSFTITKNPTDADGWIHFVSLGSDL